MQNKRSDHTRLAVWLCAGMLILCLVVLAKYLRPDHQQSMPVQPDSGLFGMMLLDIADQEAVDSYHVPDHGVYVLAVLEESPAEKAGIVSGDKLIGVDHLAVRDTSQLSSLQQTFQKGQQVDLFFQRGTKHSFSVTMAWTKE